MLTAVRWDVTPCLLASVVASDVLNKSSAFEMWVTAYQAVRCHIAEDLSLRAAVYPANRLRTGDLLHGNGALLTGILQRTDFLLFSCTSVVLLCCVCTVVLS